jgi:hypothetical protein
LRQTLLHGNISADSAASRGDSKQPARMLKRLNDLKLPFGK